MTILYIIKRGGNKLDSIRMKDDTQKKAGYKKLEEVFVKLTNMGIRVRDLCVREIKV